MNEDAAKEFIDFLKNEAIPKSKYILEELKKINQQNMKKKTFELLFFPYTDMEGNKKEYGVNYMLVFNQGKLEDVVNEYGYSCSKNGGVWDFFNKKYNK